MARHTGRQARLDVLSQAGPAAVGSLLGSEASLPRIVGVHIGKLVFNVRFGIASSSALAWSMRPATLLAKPSNGSCFH